MCTVFFHKTIQMFHIYAYCMYLKYALYNLLLIKLFVEIAVFYFFFKRNWTVTRSLISELLLKEFPDVKLCYNILLHVHSVYSTLPLSFQIQIVLELRRFRLTAIRCYVTRISFF